jgi:sn-glycerol 3-phosphate transport system ATP-binding protein
MSQISLQNLKKSFGETKVIHDLSIDVKDGELIVIVGPSGCGKSTLLRMVAGLEDANEGNILIDNKKVNELEPMETKYCHGISELCSLPSYDSF